MPLFYVNYCSKDCCVAITGNERYILLVMITIGDHLLKVSLENIFAIRVNTVYESIVLRPFIK